MEQNEGAERRINFSGRCDTNIDSKGRLLVPKEFRDRLKGDFVLAHVDLGCLAAIPLSRWLRIEDEIDRYPESNPGRQEYADLIARDAYGDQNFDEQGRVVVPKRLRELAKLDKNVVLSGAVSRVNIWSAEEFARYEADRKHYNADRRKAFEEAYLAMTGGAQ
jgi:MraZ protein